MDKKVRSWLFLSIILFSLSLFLAFRQFACFYLADFGAYCAISRALFEGNNPFPDHFEVLFCKTHEGGIVPIVYPGQMLLFVIPSYLWSRNLQIVYYSLNVAIVFFLIGLAFVKAIGWQWRDLWTPGKRQFFYALFCTLCFSSSSFKETFLWGQTPIILTFCFYFMFWGPVSFWLRTFLFAVMALVKYSILPVVAPLLFFKGHWKLCIAAFSVFVFFSISPVFCGNDLMDVYTEYSKAVQTIIQPGHINHFDTGGTTMCNLDFFKNAFINFFLKTVVFGVILWLFWRERKNQFLSDTMLLLAFCLTMLISYHRSYDLVLVYPLFLIRFCDFIKKKQWLLFGIMLLFPLFLSIPNRFSHLVSALIGRIPGVGSIVYLEKPFEDPHFPIMPFFTIALTLWSLYLYLHVEEPYRFELPMPKKKPPVQEPDTLS